MKAESTISAIKQCPKLGPDFANVGEEVVFSAPLGLASYEWMAIDTNGTFAGGFNDSSNANVTWAPPMPGTYEISFNNFRCTQLMNVKESNSGIQIDKNCDFNYPAHVGDAVTYNYSITNTGDAMLTDVKVTDMQDWGPECQPAYVKGDNDDDRVLDHGETWHYECRYIIPDPDDYPKLRIMSDAESGFAKRKDLIRRLMDMKDRLEIALSNLKLLQGQFDQKRRALPRTIGSSTK